VSALARLPFSGYSMWPFFQEGDELLVSFEKATVETGDIVIVKDEQQWISHRIVTLKNGLFLKGDFSTNLEPFNQNQMWGMVQGLKRKHKSYVWGQRGQPLKSLLARLSTMGHLSNQSFLTRLKRWISLIVLFLLSRAFFWLKSNL